MTKIRELPKSERPREKLVAKGEESLRDSELLAILLRTGSAGRDVLETAQYLLSKYPKKQLLNMKYDDLLKIKGIDSAKATTLLAAFELAKRTFGEKTSSRPIIENEEHALAQLYDMRARKKEHLAALYLNARNELIHREEISVGTVNASIVHPRDVFAPALEHNATTVVVAHNHPSGDPTPSREDREVAVRLNDAGKLLGIIMHSQLILTKDSHSVIEDRKIL